MQDEPQGHKKLPLGPPMEGMPPSALLVLLIIGGAMMWIAAYEGLDDGSVWLPSRRGAFEVRYNQQPIQFVRAVGGYVAVGGFMFYAAYLVRRTPGYWNKAWDRPAPVGGLPTWLVLLVGGLVLAAFVLGAVLIAFW